MYVRLIVTVLLSEALVCCSSQGLTMESNSPKKRVRRTQVKEIIGTDGGVARLGQVVLEVPAGALPEPTRITVKHYPADLNEMGELSFRDRYSVEPFRFRVAGERPFVLHWKTAVPINPDKVEIKQLCPKVSWTINGEMIRCYSIAGMVDVYSVKESGSEESERLIPTQKTVYTDRFGPFGAERNGCVSLSNIKNMPGEEVYFKFFTDRLGHFRILPKSSGGNMEDQLLRPLAQFDTPEGKCVYVPPSSRRSVTVLEDGKIHSWRLSCKLDEHCDEGYHCEGYSYCTRDDDQ